MIYFKWNLNDINNNISINILFKEKKIKIYLYFYKLSYLIINYYTLISVTLKKYKKNNL